MPMLRLKRRAPRYCCVEPEPRVPSGRAPLWRLYILLLLAALLLFAALSSAFLRRLSSQIAVSDARDIVTTEVNRVIAELMSREAYSPDYFISLEKNDTGEITAINSHMAHINALSSEILEQVVGRAESRTLTVEIPLGNLSGVSLLMGHGPAIPVQIVMLTSSHVEFRNLLASAGINQTRHQLNLEIVVDIDVLIPWGVESSQVVTEVLIADTLVVGQVPETYVSP